MFRLYNSIQYADPESSGGGSSTSADTTEETFELLNTEEEPTEPPLKLEGDEKEAEPESEDDDEEEVDELKELEEELKEPKEEDLLELTTPVRRREILAKYPKLFKDFPYLEKAYYREQQFTEVFPTINDARISAEKAQILDKVEQQVVNGDLSTVLRAAKSEDPEAFNRLADNYLPMLRQVDQQAYYHVLGNVIKDTIITMVREGRALGEQGTPLTAAANVLNQFVFGSQNFTPPVPLSRQVNPQERERAEQIQREDQQRFYTQFESVKDDLQTRADNVLKSTIDGHIDPNGTMTDYVKTHATREAFETLGSLIEQDSRFRSLLDKLWQKAFESGFNRDSTDKIKSAYLSKAKTLLPTVIKKARNNALKGLGSRSTRVSDESNDSDSGESARQARKSPVTLGKSTTPSNSGRIRKASDIPRGMSTLDVLMKD